MQNFVTVQSPQNKNAEPSGIYIKHSSLPTSNLREHHRRDRRNWRMGRSVMTFCPLIVTWLLHTGTHSIYGYLHICDQPKIKPPETPAWEGVGSRVKKLFQIGEAVSLAKKLPAIDYHCSHWQVPHTPGDDPTLKHAWLALIEVSGLKNNTPKFIKGGHEFGREM